MVNFSERNKLVYKIEDSEEEKHDQRKMNTIVLIIVACLIFLWIGYYSNWDITIPYFQLGFILLGVAFINLLFNWKLFFKHEKRVKPQIVISSKKF